MKNRRLTIALLLLCALATSARRGESAQSEVYKHRLMPVPASVQFRPGRLRIDRAFTVGVEGHRDAILDGAIHRASRRLEGRTALEFSRAPVSDARTATLLIECRGPAKAVPSVDEDESYSLEVSDRQAVLRAATVVGAMRGLETFLQLLEGDRQGHFIPSVSINDKPRFPWRGLMIDSARHFQPVEVLKRNLDGMAAVKLNVFHWHLTEDQGFRVESKRYPRLHQMGSDGLFYTQDQVREVIAYARDRGIRVMPEFDLPGHATSWLVGHPELGSAPGPYTIERKNGIFEPALDPTREEVYKFLEVFFTEMAQLFPDAYMHIGGDENEGHQWSRNAQIQEFMKAKGIKDNHALQAYFNQRMSKIFQKVGKKMIGWDEILHPDLPQGTAIQSWRGPQALVEAARKGYDGLLSNGYYIDLIFPTWQHYRVDPVAADANLSEQELKHILGGEATMWSEWVSPETIDSRIWPRTAAIAERFWSPREVTDVEDMYRRLDAISLQLEELGLTHEKNADMMLRRLAGTKEIGPLKTLAELVEPVKEYRRNQARTATMLTPLTRLIDAARPDSQAGRRFAALVDGLLSDAPLMRRNNGRIRATLMEWRDVRPELDVMIDKAPALREAEQLPRDLSDLSAAGLEALSYLSAGVSPPDGWREAKMAVLEQAAKPKAEVEFTVIAPLRKLVILAAEMQNMKALPHAQWKDHVLSLSEPKEAKGK
ncbi:MAG TPA: family 20 glycosylhydrolase [Blastocatellia bacterium]|nr:family 20 glycosylhydrolase [Blastocatellia bacterium]